MTQEEKQLLLIDLCARLPYETWVKYEGKEWFITGYGHGRFLLLPSIFSSIGGPCPLVEEVSPYLRSMSSMTEEEAIKYVTLTHYNTDDNGKPCRELTIEALDWLNANHFDYHNLIGKGLALEAPEGMYK